MRTQSKTDGGMCDVCAVADSLLKLSFTIKYRPHQNKVIGYREINTGFKSKTTNCIQFQSHLLDAPGLSLTMQLTADFIISGFSERTMGTIYIMEKQNIEASLLLSYGDNESAILIL